MADTVYKSRGANGEVQFSDVKRSGAQSVHVDVHRPTDAAVEEAYDVWRGHERLASDLYQSRAQRDGFAPRQPGYPEATAAGVIPERPKPAKRLGKPKVKPVIVWSKDT